MNFPSYETLLLCIVASLISKATSLIGWTQSAGVKGQLFCMGEPAEGVRVKLYDNDIGPDLDDLMDAGYTDAHGMFTLSGTTDEFSTIDPKLNIYHDCNDWLPCQRRITIMIPEQYVYEGAVIQEYYDVGKIDLEGEREGESRDCIHRR